jgi:predicted CXXCH cytochrome family protein
VADQYAETSGVEEIEKTEESGGSWRPRLALVAILLLLLLMCVVTTVADVWTTASTQDQRVAILRNIECLRCHVELMPEFGKEWVHNPFMKKRCTTCHTPHGEIVRTTQSLGPVERWRRLRTLIEWLPLRVACEVGAGSAVRIGVAGGESTRTVDVPRKGKKSELVLPETELCWMCHGDLGPKKSMAFQHNPFDKGRCTTCHDPHASDFRKLMTQDERDLCVTCHPIGRELNRKQTHPPAKNLYCLSCHDPHASDFRGILKLRQTELCFVCHPSVAMLSTKSYQHSPFINDECTSCHEPHGSDYLPLLRKEAPPLCYDCHPGLKYDFLKPSHHPVGTVKLNCQDCHNPHAADFKGLLDAKNNAMCYKCHAKALGGLKAIKAWYEPSAHGKGNILCIRCHTPHGSVYGPLLRNRNPELCLECHAWIGRPNLHPFRPTYRDVYANKPLTCTSTCHDPHGTANNYMLKRFSFPLDGQCLQCHSRVGKDF